ncbi:MAG: ABC transporter permease, partial [Halobacillus sp.]
NRLLASYMLISLIVGFVMLSLAALGLGAAALAVLEDGPSLATIYGAAMVYLPALAIFIGLAILLTGLLPKFTGLTWLYLGYSFFVVYLGGVFQFDEWVGNLTPFGHVPELPIEDVNTFVLILLTVIAAVLMAGGFIGYRNRDIQG